MATPNTIATRPSGQATGAAGLLGAVTIDTPLNDPELGRGTAWWRFAIFGWHPVR